MMRIALFLLSFSLLAFSGGDSSAAADGSVSISKSINGQKAAPAAKPSASSAAPASSPASASSSGSSDSGYRDGSIFPSGSCSVKTSTILNDTQGCRKACSSGCKAIAKSGCGAIPKSGCNAVAKSGCNAVPPTGCAKEKPCAAAAEAPCAPAPCQAARPCPAEQQPELVEIPRVDRPRCEDLAPIELQYVDFRLQKDRPYGGYSNRLGQFRFRIFGCRRETRDIWLNQGRAVQKDMRFVEIFEQATADCYKTVRTPDDLCLDTGRPLPEYVLTAEIVDYFMNVCDEHDWAKGRKTDLRSGSAEMTVAWRLMDAAKTKTVWKGTSTGYAEIEYGEYNADLHLVERAFADAVADLRQQPGFERQLAVRVSPEDQRKARETLVAFQQANTPAKCEYAAQIQEAMSIESSGRVIRFGDDAALLVENDGNTVTITLDDTDADGGEAGVSVAVKEEAADSTAKNQLCISSRKPYGEPFPGALDEIKGATVAISNARGQLGSGLLVDPRIVLSSADLIVRGDNTYTVTLLDGRASKAKAFRLNPVKNTAAFSLETPVEIAPLAYADDLPSLKGKYTSLGLAETKKPMDTDYVAADSSVSGFRYSQSIGTEILAGSFVQGTSTGGALFDDRGTVFGTANFRKRLDSGADTFLPVDLALKSLGLEICGRENVELKTDKPVESRLIEKGGSKTPGALDKKKRK